MSFQNVPFKKYWKGLKLILNFFLNKFQQKNNSLINPEENHQHKMYLTQVPNFDSKSLCFSLLCVCALYCGQRQQSLSMGILNEN